jgi:hypothetical protein
MNGNGQFPWRTTIAALTIVALALIGAVVFTSSFGWGGKVLNSAARNFVTGNITTTFLEDIPVIASTHGNVLDLASSLSTEIFRREDSLNSLWDLFYVGTTTVEIRVPVTFRYHMLLSDPWHLAAKGNVCFVQAPQFRPTLPPAINTGLMEKRAASGWARFDKNERLDELERDMTGLLVQRAQSPAHLNLVREQCRKSVGEFVKNWLIQKAQWTNNFDAIVVVFPDEQSFVSDQALSEFKGSPVITIKTR